MKKSILCILFLAISVSTFVGCNAKDTAVNNKDINIVSSENTDVNNNDIDSTMKDNVPTADMSGKLVNQYKTLDEINNDSELVVMGTIIENEYVEFGGLTFTLSKFKIDNVVKGTVNVGDIIKVLQTGGISEVKILKENNSALLLLQKYDGPITKDSYVCTGDFQGRFLVDQKTKSVTPQSKLLTETVTFDNLMKLK